MAKLTRAKVKKRLKELRTGLKKDFIASRKATSIGQKIGETRKKLGRKINTPKFKKIRRLSGERGRFIGESLGRPVRFDTF